MLVALGRGVWWVAAANLPYGDETAQLGYVESLATGHGIPVTGRDATTPGAVSLESRSPTGFAERHPGQYEGYQPPAYYVAMTPAYWLGRALDGELGALYAVRLATLLIGVAAIPLVARLARILFPRRKAAAVIAPAVLTAMDIFAAQNSLADNDGAMVALGACAFLAVLSARKGFGLRKGLLAGATVGLALLAKPTAIAELPLLALTAAWLWHRLRPERKQLLMWLAGGFAGGIVLLVPWLVFNLVEYHGLTGAVADKAEVAAIVAHPSGWPGALFLWDNAINTSFVELDSTSIPADLRFHNLWLWASVAIVGAGIAAAGYRSLRHTSWSTTIRLVGLAVALPLGTAALLAAVLEQSGAQAALAGRHLDVLFPAYCVLIAASIEELLPSKPAGVATLALLSVSLVSEIPVQQAAVQDAYQSGVIGDTAPVVSSATPIGQEQIQGVTVHPACPSTGVAIEFAKPPPPPATIDGRPLPPLPPAFSPWTYYLFPAPASGPVTVSFDRPVMVNGGAPGQAAPASYVGPSGNESPVVLVYCRVAHPDKVRFAETYGAMHPLRLTYRGVSDLAIAQAFADIAAGLAIVGVWLSGDRRRRVANGGPATGVEGPGGQHDPE